MNQKTTMQNLGSPSEIPNPFFTGMYRKSKTQELSKSQVITMKKLNAADLILMRDVIASKTRNSNFIFSPASINSVLRMMDAASGSGSDELNAVYSEIATTVFADGSASGGPKISAINGVWVEQSLPVNHSSKDLLVNVFKATYAQVDFRSKAEEVRTELNQWASDKTNGLIKDLLPDGSVTSDTNEVYGNALYFKGVWENKFDRSYTKVNEFHLLDGSSVSVPFMTSHEDQYIAAYDGFKVLRLPYRQGHGDTNREFSMYFYLPDKKDGLEDLVKKLTSTHGFVDNHVPSFKRGIDELKIPKFKISFWFKRFLKTLGLNVVVLYHKACVEIDEEGTEAAAASFRLIGRCEKISFVADHPFIFLIREDITGTVLFAGQVLDPSEIS